MITNIYKSLERLSIGKSSIIAVAMAFLFLGNTVAQNAAPATPAAAPAAGGGDVAAGAKLFKDNCSACHNANGDKLTGPGLKDIEKRRDYPWIKKWINNSASVLSSGDKYANDLYTAYNKTQMTAFPALGDAEVKNILAYVNDFNTPKAAAPAGGGANANAETGGGKLFNIVLIALLAVMALILVALMSILKLLSKASGAETEGATSQSFLAGLKNVASNKTVRKAIIWLFNC